MSVFFNFKRIRNAAVLVIAAGVLSSCATYQTKVDKAHLFLRDGKGEEAAKTLEPLAQAEGRDQLVYLLDYGLSLFESGKYREAINAFLKADKLVDMNDYVSLSKEGASLLLNEELVQYKGTSYEKILINVYLALAYLNIGEIDDAAVEARRLNQRLNYLKAEAGEKDYNRSVLARYLSAMVWEEQRNYDSAYLDYKFAYDVDPRVSQLRRDLIRSSYFAGRMEEHAKYKKQWPEENVQIKRKSFEGELVVLYAQGWMPRKVMSAGTHRLPSFSPVRVNSLFARVAVNGAPVGETRLLFDVGDMAIQTLKDDMGRLALRRAGGFAAKAIVSDQIRQKNAALGTMAYLLMNLADRADLRHWSTLPENFQILRIPLAPGQKTVTVKAVTAGGTATGEEKEFTVTIKPGKKSFVIWRSFR